MGGILRNYWYTNVIKIIGRSSLLDHFAVSKRKKKYGTKLEDKELRFFSIIHDAVHGIVVVTQDTCFEGLRYFKIIL